MRAVAALVVFGLAGGAAGESFAGRLPAVPEGARGADAFDEGEPRIEATLRVDASAVEPGGSFGVGVHFVTDPGWHVYWRNPGDSGLATQLDWSFEAGTIGPIAWPAPSAFEESDGFLTTYGYTGELLLASQARTREDARGSARIGVVADFVTCKIGCIPGRIELERTIEIAPRARPAPAAVRDLFARVAATVPLRADEIGLRAEAAYTQTAIRPGDEFRAAVRLSSCDDPALAEGSCRPWRLAAGRLQDAWIPDLVPGVELRPIAAGPSAPGDTAFALLLEGRATRDDPRADQLMRAVVPVVREGEEPTHVEVEVALPRAPADFEVAAVESPLFDLTGFASARAGTTRDREATVRGSVIRAFLLALLGGLILNLMPCVLPILAIKVFHVAELAHESRSVVWGHGAAYTAGVLASMGALAAVVISLRAAGIAVGWGFQFQEPIFLAAICTLLVVFALNLFGVFEVGFTGGGLAELGAGSIGWRRSFFEGLLAVVLATPCTAPFLGTAVGFAFASSGPVILAIFLAIGLGLAAPYVAVTAVPAWSRWIPRPGGWMVHVRRGLGFALVATVVWLLWVVGRSLGIGAQTVLLSYLVAVSFAVWLTGAMQEAGHPRLAASSAAAFAVLAIVGLARLPLSSAEPRVAVAEPGSAPGVVPAVQIDSPAGEAWRPWDSASIASELQRGRPVFVDFTADWCITCKVNESVVIADERVQAELARLGVATFKADWTRHDDEIRAELASFGKAGVPMYLVYSPDDPARPQVLPELLTVDLMLDALREAAGGSGV